MFASHSMFYFYCEMVMSNFFAICNNANILNLPTYIETTIKFVW